MSEHYGKQDLLEALKKADADHPELKIPYSYRSLLRLEKLGVIPVCNSPLKFKSGAQWRLYTIEEVEAIVQKVIEYKSKK